MDQRLEDAQASGHRGCGGTWKGRLRERGNSSGPPSWHTAAPRCRKE